MVRMLDVILLLVLMLCMEEYMCLICNYCYHANIREDCHLNVMECERDHVCSVETSVVSYHSATAAKADKSATTSHVLRKFHIYRMGCEHYSLCRDRIVSGPGPYGYAVTRKVCCCDKDLCEDGDGIGRGITEHCPSLWNNYTTIVIDNNKATYLKPSLHIIYILCVVVTVLIV